MKQRRFNILLILLATILMGACSTTQRILSTEEPEDVYQRAMAYMEEEKWNKASRCFENVMMEYLGGIREDSIIFYNSKCKFKGTDYSTATSYFEGFRNQFTRSPFLEDAEGMLVLCYYYTSPGVERDPANIYQTLSAIEEFKARYPTSKSNENFEEIKQELTQRLHDRSYLSAYTYYKTGKYKSAIVAFKSSLKEFPESTNREKIMYYMILSGYELAHNSIPSLQVDRYLSLMDMYYTFVAEFPESEWRKDVDGILAKSKSFLEKNNSEVDSEVPHETIL